MDTRFAATYYLNNNKTNVYLTHHLKFILITELKSGRVPQGLTHRLGFWKAEDLQKFAYPASECVLGGLLSDEEYHIWVLAVRLTELVFGAGRSGWTKDMLQLTQHLILRHNILTEEVQGLQSCRVTFHNLIHLPEDVERFSSPDNYWCFSFERAVSNYITRSSNKKNIEHTFANAESRREFLKFSRERKTMEVNTDLTAGDMVSPKKLYMHVFL